MGARQRILLIEDDLEIADNLRLFLTSKDFQFFHATTGQKALPLASRVIPHAILMDVTLPDLDGYSLAARLRSGARTAHIPLLIAAQWSDRDQRLAGLSLDADDFITKPFDLQELLLRLQNTVARVARNSLTDLRTGLPAAFKARQRLTQARLSPGQAIVEVALEHMIPFFNVYGSAAGAQAYCFAGQLLINVANRYGSADDFIGYLDEDTFVIITRQESAYPLAEELASRFNSEVATYYSEEDRAAGHVHMAGRSHPLMRLVCRVTLGDNVPHVPETDGTGA